MRWAPNTSLRIPHHPTEYLKFDTRSLSLCKSFNSLRNTHTTHWVTVWLSSHLALLLQYKSSINYRQIDIPNIWTNLRICEWHIHCKGIIYRKLFKHIFRNKWKRILRQKGVCVLIKICGWRRLRACDPRYWSPIQRHFDPYPRHPILTWAWVIPISPTLLSNA